jgi:hypothetical protein
MHVQAESARVRSPIDKLALRHILFTAQRERGRGREREKEREKYIYIYKERKRERERESGK